MTTRINSQLEVTQTATFDTNVSIAGGVTITQTATFNGDVSIAGGVTMTGTATFNDNVVISGGVTITETATFNSDVSIAGGATITETATFNSDVSIAGGVTITETATFNSGVSIAGEVTVTGTATFNGKLAADSFQLNGGGVVDIFQKYAYQVPAVTVTSGETYSVTFTATGVSVGDFTFTQTPDGQSDDLVSTAYVDSADVVKLKIHNVNKNTDQATTTETWGFLAISFV